MTKILNKYWFWFSLVVILYSSYDYFEHISREGSTFEKNPFAWFLFSGGATFLLLAFVLLSKRLIEKITQKENLLFEVVAIGGWIILHVYLFGPLLIKLFWPFSEITFYFNISGFIILLGIYYIFRVIVNAIIKKQLFR